MSEGRNTARRERFRRAKRRDGDDCAACGLPIDYEAHHLDPLSFQIDHITPLARGGSDTLDNIQAMHRMCNRDKGDSLPTDGLHPTPGVTYETHREWRP
ncbi:HNH endonuclease [Mycobacterium phage LeMond]|uniref:HNH endonuclease n=1 Tax=Mycobacterium phage KiSi TaxID=2507856 RepID=A0A410TBY3_9CAUD|nr:HNH endonuclease [Mycobacterium phage KiSi]AYR01168.1 HNH endonuclease [Mycobacterium phage LeMond]AYR01271.1 HNH endonuclease [Mycobacterium phage Oscar]AYR01703.1 HNH endonuclease [Mycobacterium phage Scarlett]QAU06522.1 HNH endonuclease [Mycobacterium phage KiSi]